jgi:hypothetical protein
MFTAALSATAAVTAALVAVGLGAFTGGLPRPVQRLAHAVIGAPAPVTEQTVSASPVPAGLPSGHHGTGQQPGHSQAPSSLTRLCTSYQQEHGHGGGIGRSEGFHELIKAAGGAGKISAFCATVLHPGTAPHPKPKKPKQAKPPEKPKKPKKPKPPHGNGHSHGNGNSQGYGVPDPRGAGGLVPHH